MSTLHFTDQIDSIDLCRAVCNFKVLQNTCIEAKVLPEMTEMLQANSFNGFVSHVHTPIACIRYIDVFKLA